MLLVEYGIRRITFVMVRECGVYPGYFTYRSSSFERKTARPYYEDVSIRNVEPAMAYLLELSRLSNFRLKPMLNVDNRELFMYFGTGKTNPADSRFFIRCLIRPQPITGEESLFENPEATAVTKEYLISEGDRILKNALDALEIAMEEHQSADCNHILMNFIPSFDNIRPEDVVAVFPNFMHRHGRRLWRLRVTAGEIRITVRPSPEADLIPLRFFLSSVSGFVLHVDSYRELRDSITGDFLLKSLSRIPGSFENCSITSPHPPREDIQPKRYKAHSMGTTYVYDFLNLFKRALQQVWLMWEERLQRSGHTTEIPTQMISFSELVLNDQDELENVSRPPGQNDIGMVGWRLKLFTPEYPHGREIIVIANDITYQIGSFGPREDLFFYKCSQLARQLGIPRIYLSANSGARIGLAEELLKCYRAAWKDEKDPTKGFEYLYLTEDDHSRLAKRAKELDMKVENSVRLVRIEVDNQVRYKILDIIGLKDGLGVENLQGSGLIAGETSQAYREIFTITLVTCRSVGIGAYLVRLGQRAIQIEGHPIILTGFAALNKVLGRNVYNSNLQLGGTQIMFQNGVSHLTASDDYQGIVSILSWLAYVPHTTSSPLPITPLFDPVDRIVEYYPPQTESYDARHLIEGIWKSGKWLGGLFDQDSFLETLGGWAKTIVTGRARLGGIPVGILAVDTRTISYIVPADPANPDSHEQQFAQPGQVWFPNSSFKTAQAIRDFNNGEQLPLFILANWRGFSGGMNDMYHEILKYGSMIVDALNQYRQPVFIYLPPFAELRGGAWVVLDPTINSEMMEMYADPQSRGGVLEPDGIVEIKYRSEQMNSLMERLDQEYASLKSQVDNCTDDSQKSTLQKQLSERYQKLLPVYQNVTVQFASLHDTPVRMKAKSVIRDIVDWRESRKFFYWRLRRRLAEERARKILASSDMPRILRNDLNQTLLKLYHQDFSGGSLETESMVKAVFDNDDQAIVNWLDHGRGQHQLMEYHKKIRCQHLKSLIEKYQVEIRDLQQQQ